MTYYIIYYIFTLLLNISSVRLIHTALQYEITKKKIILCVAMMTCAASQLILVLPSFLFSPPVRIIILIALMLVKAGGYSVIFGKLHLSMLYISVLSFVTNSNYTNILLLITKNKLMLNILACAIETLFLFSLTLYIRHKKCAVTIASSLKVIPKSLYLIILAFLYIMSFFEYTSVIQEYNYIARIMILPVILTITYIITRIMKISIAEQENERISQLLSVQLENQIQYYQKINSIYAEFRGFRHDFQNHLICLRSLLAENEVQRALSYMEEIENMSYTQKKNYDTGNIIVDSLLSDKSEKASACQTKILFSGFSPTTGITSADLCTIFANALDNAIEACAKDTSTETKEIKVDSDFKQGCFFLKITNPIFEKVEIKNDNQVKTSKDNPNMHGFGVANIVKTVKKYDGTATLSSDDFTFTLEVMLWLKSDIS